MRCRMLSLARVTARFWPVISSRNGDIPNRSIDSPDHANISVCRRSIEFVRRKLGSESYGGAHEQLLESRGSPRSQPR